MLQLEPRELVSLNHAILPMMPDTTLSRGRELRQRRKKRYFQASVYMIYMHPTSHAQSIYHLDACRADAIWQSQQIMSCTIGAQCSGSCTSDRCIVSGSISSTTTDYAACSSLAISCASHSASLCISSSLLGCRLSLSTAGNLPLSSALGTPSLSSNCLPRSASSLSIIS